MLNRFISNIIECCKVSLAECGEKQQRVPQKEDFSIYN